MVNQSLRSMTGFAVLGGEGQGHAWTWEARSVNGKGLDLRLRIPDGFEGIEAEARAEVSRRFSRGNIALTLKLDRVAGAAIAAVDPAGLARALASLALIEDEAMRAGLTLRESSAADILAIRGVADPSRHAEADGEALRRAILDDLGRTLDALAAMRAAEGAALARVLAEQVDRIERLTGEVATEAAARAPRQAEAFRAALARVTEAAEGADPARVAQELAILAVKADVTEEIDRLGAHVAAARALLAAAEPVGRRLDFLAQEFNREANTVASKSGSAGLTRVALELKATIDQWREQVQNVE